MYPLPDGVTVPQRSAARSSAAAPNTAPSMPSKPADHQYPLPQDVAVSSQRSAARSSAAAPNPALSMPSKPASAAREDSAGLLVLPSYKDDVPSHDLHRQMSDSLALPRLGGYGYSDEVQYSLLSRNLSMSTFSHNAQHSEEFVRHYSTSSTSAAAAMPNNCPLQATPQYSHYPHQYPTYSPMNDYQGRQHDHHFPPIEMASSHEVAPQDSGVGFQESPPNAKPADDVESKHISNSNCLKRPHEEDDDTLDVALEIAGLEPIPYEEAMKGSNPLLEDTEDYFEDLL